MPPHSPPRITHESCQAQAVAWRDWPSVKPKSSTSTHSPAIMHATTIWVRSSTHDLVATTCDRSRRFLLSISSSPPPPLDQPTHDWSPLSLSRFASLFSSIAHSFLLPLSVWPKMTVFDEWFFVLSFIFLSLYVEIFYYKICLEAEKMWKTSRKWAFS